MNSKKTVTDAELKIKINNNQLNRCELMKLSLEQRRCILEEQAEAMLQHYQQDQEWQQLETGEFIDKL